LELGRSQYPDGGGHIVAASADVTGGWIATASSDAKLRLWAVDTPAEPQWTAAYAAAVLALTFSADSAQVITIAADRSARVWDACTGELLYTFDLAHTPALAAFAVDPTRAVTVSATGGARVWDLES